MSLLAPAFLAGLMAIAIPVMIHLIHRERRETVAFPSLMFLRKIPYRSVRRQKLRHLLLLALRCLAIAIVVAAFARPFLQRQVAAPPTGPDGREVVLLMDRSYSMAHGSRWSRAASAARTIASGLRSMDRLSVVTFASSASQVVAPTSDAGRIERGVADARPGSEPTRFAPAFRMAAQILSASELPRKEIILVSDFHRAGWTRNDEVTLPPRTNVRTVDVSRGENDDVAVASVAIARKRTGDRVRATITARVTNLGTESRSVDATLELAGRRIESRRVTIPARNSAQVVFASAPVSNVAARGVVRITADSQPANDTFYFVVAEQSGASALILEPPRARANQSLYLTRALAVADDPAVEVDVKREPSSADLRGRSLIVLNEADIPAGAFSAQLKSQIERGAILLVIPGDNSTGNLTPEWRALLPAQVGAITDRFDGGRWSSVDFTNPLLEPFRAAGSAGFASITFTRYRALTPAAGAQVIARLDDGAPLFVERAVGAGRILMWAASIDANWGDLPFHPLFVPLVHQLARRSLAGSESRSWFTAPHALDLSRERDVIVESPSGERIRVQPDARPTVELRERGFYEMRGSTTALGAGQPLAVNVDLAESDLSHFDPRELVAAVTARGQRTEGNQGSAGLPGTAEELERQQRIWWYLLFAGVLVLAFETLLSNRLSRRPRPIEQQPIVARGRVS